MKCRLAGAGLAAAAVLGLGLGASGETNAASPASRPVAPTLVPVALGPCAVGGTGMAVDEPPPTAEYEPALEPVVEVARQDLAGRLGVDPGEIVVIEVTSVIWPDRGLGCPRLGVAYPQVPQDGLLIRLWAGNCVFAYHAGAGRAPFLCEAGEAVPGPAPLPAPAVPSEGN